MKEYLRDYSYVLFKKYAELKQVSCPPVNSFQNYEAEALIRLFVRFQNDSDFSCLNPIKLEPFAMNQKDPDIKIKSLEKVGKLSLMNSVSKFDDNYLVLAERSLYAGAYTAERNKIAISDYFFINHKDRIRLYNDLVSELQDFYFSSENKFRKELESKKLKLNGSPQDMALDILCSFPKEPKDSFDYEELRIRLEKLQKFCAKADINFEKMIRESRIRNFSQEFPDFFPELFS